MAALSLSYAAQRVKNGETSNAHDRKRVTEALDTLLQYGDVLSNQIELAEYWDREHEAWLREQTLVTVKEAFERQLWESPEKVYVTGFTRSPYAYNQVHQMFLQEDGQYMLVIEPYEGISYSTDGDEKILHGVKRNEVDALQDEVSRLHYELKSLKRLISQFINDVNGVDDDVV